MCATTRRDSRAALGQIRDSTCNHVLPLCSAVPVSIYQQTAKTTALQTASGAKQQPTVPEPKRLHILLPIFMFHSMTYVHAYCSLPW